VAKIIAQRTVESAKPPKEGRATKADGIVPGMQFIVHAGGKKSFRLIARVLANKSTCRSATPP
jgi:hypothetical protein